MDILSSGEWPKLLQHVQAIRHELDQWVFAETRLHASDKRTYSTRDIASMLGEHFSAYKGKVQICNAAECLMVIQWQSQPPAALASEIKENLPQGTCEVDVFPPGKDGLARLELNFAALVADGSDHFLARQLREENVVMTADDDVLMRKLIRKFMDASGFKTVEAADETSIVAEYLRHLPDVLLLDVGFPNRNGLDILREILSADPDAYVVMLSSHSTQDNVIAARKIGAKGFLAKPASREKVLNMILKCPTIYTESRRTVSKHHHKKTG